MVLNCFKALLADNVLHAAGVLCGDLFVNAKTDQPFGQQFVTFIYHLGDFPAGVCQIDKPSGVTVI